MSRPATASAIFNLGRRLSGSPDRESPDYYTHSDEADQWIEVRGEELAKSMCKGLLAGHGDQYELGKQLSQIDDDEMYELAQMAMQGRADDLLEAFKRHVDEAINAAADDLATKQSHQRFVD